MATDYIDASLVVKQSGSQAMTNDSREIVANLNNLIEEIERLHKVIDFQREQIVKYADVNADLANQLSNIRKLLNNRHVPTEIIIGSVLLQDILNLTMNQKGD